MNIFLAAGALSGMLAVIIGAFGAHGLEDLLSPDALQRYQTGVEYQFYHVPALLAVGIISSRHENNPPTLQISGIFFILGTFLFSGSLYLYAFTGKIYIALITPAGGLCFIIAWIALLLYSFRDN